MYILTLNCFSSYDYVCWTSKPQTLYLTMDNSDKQVVRKMPVERGPTVINDFKEWVGKQINL